MNKLEELKAKIEVATQALEDIMVDPTWGLEHETYMRCRAALRKLKEENDMTKLEELKAACDAAYDAACDRASAGLDVSWGDFHDARDAYRAELSKQEENE